MFLKSYLFIAMLIVPLSAPLAGQPLKRIPPAFKSKFTENGEIPVHYWYRNDSYPSTKPLIYTREKNYANLRKIENKSSGYYGDTDQYLYQAIEMHLHAIQGKEVAIIGSATPWYESIILYYGGHPTSIDYNKIVSKDPRIKTMTVEEYEQNPKTFDAVISISSFEHDGLGRYGDPINPYGDFEAMKKTRKMLKQEGLLFLAVPIGKDRLCWNVHRIYGRLRLPKLLEGWKLMTSFGFTPDDLDRDSIQGKHQPVFVLY